MADNVVTRDTVLNYSGILFDKGSARTPLFSLIKGRRRVSQSKDFVCGQYYTTPKANAQPAITETQSLTAPDADYVTRTQMENCTQIFQESVYVSYAKMSDMNSLAGLNVAGQTANPIDERAFQIGVTMDKIGSEVEYSIVNGEYQKAVNASTAGKTRGIIEAITTNVVAKLGTPALKYWDIVEAATSINDNEGDIFDLTIMCDNVHYLQLTANAIENGLTVVEDDSTVNGVRISRIKTPYGTYGIIPNSYVPKGTALLLNIPVMGVVEQLVPGKGNFFYEELAKTGAGEKGEIFGQLGLDHGPEWYHAKITGLATTFTAPADRYAPQEASSNGGTQIV